jgi:hypothetical protein
MLGMRISPNHEGRWRAYVNHPKPFTVIRYGKGFRVQVNPDEVWFIEGNLMSWVAPRTLLESQKRVHQALELRKYTVPIGILKEVSQFIYAKN